MGHETAPPGLTGWVSALARRHTTPLAAVARSEGLTGDDALDAVQDAFVTFLGLAQARKLFENEEDARGFLTVIVRNAARNARRRHHRAHLADDTGAEELAGDSPSVDSLIVEGEEHVALLGCVQKLVELHRHVVTMRMLEELSGAEAGDLLGLTPGHVAVLLHRAKVELRQCLTA
jgi:RNA polymerase sigma-70 factor, ECF subfamily